MKRAVFITKAVIAVLALSSFLGARDEESFVPAELVIINARIYTVNGRQPWAQAIAIRQGTILAVGNNEDMKVYEVQSTRVLDAKGHFLMPGITDCHIHFLDGSLSLGQAALDDAKTLTEIQQRVKVYATTHADAKWILGRGWQYPVFAPTGLPDKKFLDEVVPDRPVYLEGFDGHTWWANSKALQLAGITRETKDPPNGKFVRDPKTGEPTGAIKEDEADEIMRRAIPQASREEKLAALRRGLREANRVGLVRVHSMGGVNIGTGDFANIDLYDQLRRADQLTVRFYMAYRANPPSLTPGDIEQVESARRRYHDDWLDVGGVKMFLDGVVESHTAAMLQPYSDDPTQSGRLFWDPEQYMNAVEELDRRGFQIFTHAIGDRAVRLALDAYQHAHKANTTRDMRDRVEHIETISEKDIPRFGKEGVIASMQPLHAYPDDDTLNIWARNVGPEREKRGFAWNSIATAGGHLAFGSDWPVVTQNPWQGIQSAITRQTTDGKPPGGWLPEQRVTLQQAIEAYTLGAAYSAHRERSEGSLQPGKVADLIILDQNLFETPAYKVGDTQVLITMVGGKVVYQSPLWQGQEKNKKKNPFGGPDEETH
jgi:predicted amidohydrolase YtcJ